jgi:hypothetical protein
MRDAIRNFIAPGKFPQRRETVAGMVLDRNITTQAAEKTVHDFFGHQYSLSAGMKNRISNVE